MRGTAGEKVTPPSACSAAEEAASSKRCDGVEANLADVLEPSRTGRAGPIRTGITGQVLSPQEEEPGAPLARSLRDERDHRAADRGVIATAGEHSCDATEPRDRNATHAITPAPAGATIAFGCRGLNARAIAKATKRSPKPGPSCEICAACATAFERVADAAEAVADALHDSDIHAPLASCTFCGKRSQQVRRMIARPEVLIYDQCVSTCVTRLGPGWRERHGSD